MTHRVDFLGGAGGPLGAGPGVEVAAGTSLLAATRLAGLPLARACGGGGLCGRCGVEVLEGAGSLSPESPEERAAKERNRVGAQLRLACRARVGGGVTVRASYW